MCRHWFNICDSDSDTQKFQNWKDVPFFVWSEKTLLSFQLVKLHESHNIVLYLPVLYMAREVFCRYECKKRKLFKCGYRIDELYCLKLSQDYPESKISKIQPHFFLQKSQNSPPPNNKKISPHIPPRKINTCLHFSIPSKKRAGITKMQKKSNFYFF